MIMVVILLNNNVMNVHNDNGRFATWRPLQY